MLALRSDILVRSPVGYPAVKAQPPSIPVRVRTSAGTDHNFRVYDLSRGGCMFDRGIWGIREGQRVWISFAAVANMRATVAWVEDEMVGLVFDDVLHEAIYDHLRRPLGD